MILYELKLSDSGIIHQAFQLVPRDGFFVGQDDVAACSAEDFFDRGQPAAAGA